MFVVLKKNLRDDAKDEAENEEDDVYFGDQHSGRGFECREAYYCMYHYSGCRMEEKKYVLMKMKLHFEKNYLRVCAVFCVSKVFVCLSKKKNFFRTKANPLGQSPLCFVWHFKSSAFHSVSLTQDCCCILPKANSISQTLNLNFYDLTFSL